MLILVTQLVVITWSWYLLTGELVARRCESGETLKKKKLRSPTMAYSSN